MSLVADAWGPEACKRWSPLRPSPSSLTIPTDVFYFEPVGALLSTVLSQMVLGTRVFAVCLPPSLSQCQVTQIAPDIRQKPDCWRPPHPHHRGRAGGRRHIREHYAPSSPIHCASRPEAALWGSHGSTIMVTHFLGVLLPFNQRATDLTGATYSLFPSSTMLPRSCTSFNLSPESRVNELSW